MYCATRFSITFQPASTTITVIKAVKRHEPQRDAVHAEVVVNIEARNPGALFDKLHGAGDAVEPGIQRKRHQKSKTNRAKQAEQAPHRPSYC